jgi:hypothetical protein
MPSREITRDHVEGQARFAVIKETAVLFDQFNNAIGANLQVL